MTRWWIAWMLFIGLVAPCWGDVILLRQGDRLVGKVVDRNDSHLILDHPVLGQIELPWTQIQSYQIQSSDTPTSPTTSPTTVQTPSTSPSPALRPAPRISLEQDTATSQPVGTEDLLDAQAMTPALPADSFLDNWDAHLELSLTGSEGNTQTTALRIGMRARKETLDDRWNFDSLYDFARDGGTRTRNRNTTGVIKDWLIPDSPYFTFAQGRYDYDQFNTFRHRVSGTGGVGVNLAHEQDLDIILRGGLGATKQFGAEEQAILPEASLGGEINYFLTQDHHLSLASTVISDLLDPNQFRVRTIAAWTSKLDRARGLSLRLSLENEYQSQVSGEAKPSDLRYFVSLLFDF